MNKNCTSLEQSQKLIELGIDVNTADMYYNEEQDETYLKYIVDTKYPMVIREGQKHYLEEYGIPAWSLSALLNIIKNRKDCNKVEFLSNYSSKWVLTTTYYNSVWKEKEIIAEYSIDTAFEMVVWLLENDYIKKRE